MKHCCVSHGQCSPRPLKLCPQMGQWAHKAKFRLGPQPGCALHMHPRRFLQLSVRWAGGLGRGWHRARMESPVGEKSRHFFVCSLGFCSRGTGDKSWWPKGLQP